MLFHATILCVIIVNNKQRDVLYKNKFPLLLTYHNQLLRMRSK